MDSKQDMHKRPGCGQACFLPDNAGGGGGSRIGSGKGLGGSGGGGSGDKRQPIVVLTLAYAAYTLGVYCGSVMNCQEKQHTRALNSAADHGLPGLLLGHGVLNCSCLQLGPDDPHTLQCVEMDAQCLNRSRGRIMLLLYHHAVQRPSHGSQFA